MYKRKGRIAIGSGSVPWGISYQSVIICQNAAFVLYSSFMLLIQLSYDVIGRVVERCR